MKAHTAHGWDGSFTITMIALIAHAKGEFEELDRFMASIAYRDAPGAVQLPILAAWHRASESLTFHRECLADYCAPWFDGSAFEEDETIDDATRYALGAM